MTSSLLVVLASVFLSLGPQSAGTDSEGFIRSWLVLAPIHLDSESGATEIDKDYLKGTETTARPKAGDTVNIGGKDLAWQAHNASNYYIDFLQAFGKEAGEYVAGYAVAYVVADADMKVTLALSTNDQGKAWLNGKEIFKFAETRVLDKDTDRVEVSLNKGQNVLMLKVINEVNNWQGCARFLKDGVPVKTLTVSTTPQ
jgi:hypothetical protein